MKNFFKVLVLDIETTGLDFNKDLIVEVGIVELDLLTGEIKELFSSLCREDALRAKHRDSWIFDNGYIKVEDVRSAPSFNDIRGDIQDILDAYPSGVLAFNKKFDFTFMRKRGFKFVDSGCIMLACTNICKIPSRSRYGCYKWPNAEEAYNILCMDKNDMTLFVESHRGADDAKHEAEILYKIIKDHHFEVNTNGFQMLSDDFLICKTHINPNNLEKCNDLNNIWIADKSDMVWKKVYFKKGNFGDNYKLFYDMAIKCDRDYSKLKDLIDRVTV